MSLKNTLLPLAFLCLFMHPLFSQQLRIEDTHTLNTTHKISLLHKVVTIENRHFLLAETRLKGGDLDGLLVEIDKKGIVLQEYRIGKPNAYERVVDLFKQDDGFLLVLNKVQKNRKSVDICSLNADLFVVKRQSISLNQQQEGTAAIYDAEKKHLVLTIAVEDMKKNFYPVFLTYDVANSRQISKLTLNNKNEYLAPNATHEIAMPILDEDGELIYKENGRLDYKLIERPVDRTLYKMCNKIIYLNEEKTAYLLVGYEGTTKVTDFWVAKVADGKLAWEKIYMTEVGGDEAFEVVQTNEGNLLVTGIDYSKKRDNYYTSKALLLDKNGHQIQEQIFGERSRTWYKGTSYLTPQQFLIVGHSEDITRPKSFRGDVDINTSDLELVLVNEKGEELTTLRHETPVLEKACTIAALSEQEALVLYNSGEEETLKMMVVRVE